MKKKLRKIAGTVSRLLPDKLYLKMRYRCVFHRKLDLEDPKTYSEKLQWLKLYDRNPLYMQLVDKYEVKSYVASVLGEQHVIPTIGVWDKFEDIDFSKLPDQFVLKCTHDSGGLVICKDKSKLDIGKAREKINARLKRNYYWGGREWPYKDVKPRIIAEKFMIDDSGIGLKDYKFFCFDGKVKSLFIATERGVEGTDVKFDFFDENFNHLPFRHGHENAVSTPPKPEKFEEMIALAEKISAGFPHVRADFYNINGDIYFGELTFYHHCGFVPFTPEEWDYKFGSWINLTKLRG